MLGKVVEQLRESSGNRKLIGNKAICARGRFALG